VGNTPSKRPQHSKWYAIVLGIRQIQDSDLPPALKPIAIAFRIHGERIYPSVDLVAWKTGTSYRTVQRAVGTLRRLGVLVPQGNARGGRGRSTRYRFVAAKLPSRPAWVPSGRQKGRQHCVAVSRRQKGDTQGTKRATNGAQKGDTAVSHDLFRETNRGNSTRAARAGRPDGRVSTPDWKKQIYDEVVTNA
jgi:hypothetical protein